MAKSRYKPLLFTTTVRNPERYKYLLKVLLKYDGKILTTSLIDKVVFDLIANKLYIPFFVSRTLSLKKQLVFAYEPFSDTDTAKIIRNSPQNHKEAGFEKGWASRFDTFYKFAKELGFVYYEMNKVIEISTAGLKLANATEAEYSHLEQQIFLNAFVKYQRNNPFRRVLNANRPLVLLLQTIEELKKIDPNSTGITRLETPLILCWRDGNAAELASHIKNLRDKYGFKPSNEIVYEACKDLLNITTAGEKQFKPNNILNELPDEFIRKMRMTGLISMRGGGRFIDFNTLETEKIRYVLKRYTGEIPSFATERDFYDYMRVIDTNLVTIEARLITSESTKERLLNLWVDK
ncbi:MAG: AlwI family type II restriction endonuclease, partial [Deferribacteraceae bacterium]|nr:AlwI family type II restriction endonuclease [Deferribacteraceae bacterium]